MVDLSNDTSQLQSDRDLQPALRDLQPAAFWTQFDQFSAIPRDSGQEHLIREHLINIAQEHNWPAHTDKAGNLVINVPGRGKGLNAQPVALQSHLDMVCVAEADHVHDFTKDGITFERKEIDGEDVLTAVGTTAGFDNGFGGAMSMAMALDPSLEDCPPLYLIFTVEEETGLVGAKGFDATHVSAKYLLNLDNGTNGIRIGCAGSAQYEFEWDLHTDPIPEDFEVVELHLAGLEGGHSGLDIHRGGANAIQSLARLVQSMPSDLRDKAMLIDFQGGEKLNAIPESGRICIALPQVDASALHQRLTQSDEWARIHLKDSDAELSISKVDEIPDTGVTAIQTEQIVYAIGMLQCGVLEWNEGGLSDIPLTSNTCGVVTMYDGVLNLVGSIRSSDDHSAQLAYSSMDVTVATADGRSRYQHRYSGWKIAPEESLVRAAEEVYISVYGENPVFVAPHSGVEPGVILERAPSLEQAVSLGPRIRGHHTPDERIVLETVEPFYNFLQNLLERLC